MKVYYNENSKKKCAALKELMHDGHIRKGEIDDRSIADVQPQDLIGFDRCHFFAGLGLWDFALDLAGAKSDGPIWTASCPCPPFSAAGKKGRCPECGEREIMPCPVTTAVFACALCGHAWDADGRHLYPELRRLAEGGE